MKAKSGLIFLSGLFASTQVLATLTPTFERGEKNIYHTSPRGVQEVCVIPKKFPGGKYKKKDLKKEQELCHASFYDVTPEEQVQGYTTAGVCAKLNSTNPGVNIYKLKEGQNKSEIESKGCVGAGKLGKYKNSISCSATPAIVGYYHLSRILGRVGRVPVSVLRSMDIETHKALGSGAMKTLEAQKKTGELIYQTWSGLMSNLNAGLASKKKDQLLSDDGRQSYGAVIANPKNENFYTEMFTKGADRAVAFRDNNALFKLVRTEKPLDQMFKSTWTADNVQKLYAMKDATEFILMDHILDQQDRFGNVAEVNVYAYMAKEEPTDTEYELQLDKDKEKYDAALAAGLVDTTRAPLLIKSMVLKDNDCGVTKTNVVKAASLLKAIRHMDPKTYKKLLQFQAAVTTNQDFFTKNLMFTTTDYKEMVANVNDAVNILKTNCKAGLLRLDLDVDYYFEKGKLRTSGSCELKVEAEVK